MSAALLLVFSLTAPAAGQYLLSSRRDGTLSALLYAAGLVAFLSSLAAHRVLSSDHRPWRLPEWRWRARWPCSRYRTALGGISALLLAVSLATMETAASRVTLGAWSMSLLLAMLAAAPSGLLSFRAPGRHMLALPAGWRSPGEPRGVVRCQEPPPGGLPAGVGIRWAAESLLRSLRRSHREVAAVSALLLVGAALRLHDLAGVPSGIHGDETGHALIALSILEGKGPNPFGTAFYGDRALYFYLHAPFFALFGKTVMAMRAFSALAGIATLPLFYLLVRRLFGVRPALIALALLAGSAVHINYGRLGLNIVQIPLLTVAGLYCLRMGQESRRPFWWFAAGIVGGLAVYFAFGGILVPLTVALYLLYLCVVRSSELRAWVAGGALAALGGTMALLPIPVFAMGRNTPYSEHVASRLIFSNWEWVSSTHNTSGWGGVLLGQLKANLLFFFAGHDFGPFYGFVAAPMLAGVLGPFVALGLVLMLVRARDERYGMLVIWFWTVLLFGGVFTINSPQSHRILPAALAALVGVALVLNWLVVAGPRLLPRPAAPAFVALAVAVPLMAGYVEAANYFGPAVASRPWAPETQQSHYFASLGAGYRGYTLASPWHPFDSSVARFLAPEVEVDGLPNPGLRLPLAVPPDRDLAFMVLPTMSHYLPLLRSLYPSATVDEVLGGDGQLAYTSLQVSRAEVARWQGLTARYGAIERVEADARTLGGGATAYPAEAIWSGSIYVEQDGVYRFQVRGEAAVLLIDGAPVDAGRPLTLWPGWHTLEVTARLPEAGSRVLLEWAPPDHTLSPVPSHLLDARRLPANLRGFATVGPGRDLERRDRTIGFRDLGQLFPGEGPLRARWEGTLIAPLDGEYGFGLRSNGRAAITIDGGTVAASSGERWGKPALGSVPLTAGEHSFSVEYDGHRDGGLLEVLWVQPGGELELMPPEYFEPPRIRR